MISGFFEQSKSGKPLKVAKKTDEELAWLNQDWEALDKIIKRQLEEDAKAEGKPQNIMFVTLDNINKTKVEMDIDYEYESYNKFMINRAMSQHVDVLPEVVMMNKIGEFISNQHHYDYYRLSTPPKSRRGSWATMTEDLRSIVIERMIQERWTVSPMKARSYKAMLIANGELDSFIKDNMHCLEDSKFVESLHSSKKERTAIVNEFKRIYRKGN